MADRESCLGCCHFQFDLGHADWSDLAPGDPPDVRCRKGHWAASRNDSEVTFRKNMATAVACRDFVDYKSEAPQ